MASSSSPDILLAAREDLEDVAVFLSDLGGPHFADRFPGKTAADFYRWKYFENPAGNALVAIARSDQRVVSAAAAIPKRVRCDGATYVAYELGDFLTAPDHRKQGLFSKLIDLLCNEAAQHNAALVYVRPNDISFPILEKHLRFEEPNRFDNRRFIVLSRSLQRRTGVPAGVWRALGIDRAMRAVAAGGENSSPGIRVEPSDNFGAADDLWTAAETDYRFALIRNSSYMSWRYLASPTPYRVYAAHRGDVPAGYAVTFLQRGDAVGFIADLFTRARDKTAAQSLASACIRDLVNAGAAAIYTWTLDAAADSAAHEALMHTCRFREPSRLHIAVRFLAADWNKERLPDRGWHLALGDFDGI